MFTSENQRERNKDILKILFFGIFGGGFFLSIIIGIGTGLYKAIEVGQYGLPITMIFLKTVTAVTLRGCAITSTLCLIAIICFTAYRFVHGSAYIFERINERSRRAGILILGIIIIISLIGFTIMIMDVSKLYKNDNFIDTQTNTTIYICGDISCPRNKLS